MLYNEAFADARGCDKVALEDAYIRLNQAVLHPEEFEDVVAVVEALEFELQGLWGFSQDKKFHRYQVYIKGCTCPRMDNAELFGATEHRYVVSDCPWHWKPFVENIKEDA